MIGRVTLAALAASICLDAPAYAQKFGPANVDASDVEGLPVTTDAATLGDQPFWTAVEPYVGKTGFCGKPGQELVRRMPVEGELPEPLFEFEEAVGVLAKFGFERTFEWFTQYSIAPFPKLLLESVDPRAPGLVPVFCTTSPLPENSKLRPDYFEFDVSGLSDVYIYLKRRIGAEGGGDDAVADYNTDRILLSTMLIAMEMYFYDQQTALFSDDTRFFGGLGENADEFRESFAERRWFFRGVADAIAVKVFEDKQGPSFQDFDKNFERLTYLYGEIDKPFTTYRTDEGDETTNGGFFYFLLGDYLNDRFDLIPELVRIGWQADNLLKELDDFIDKYDHEELHGLESALASYSAYALNWADGRFNGAISEERWKQEAYGGCRKLNVSEAQIFDEIVVEIPPYASVCVEVDIAAVNQAWNGYGQFRLQIAGKPLADDRIDDVYLSTAELDFKTQSATCYDTMVSYKDSVTCLDAPEQGREPRGVLQRYYAPLPLIDFDQGSSYTQLYTLSYAPSDHQPGDGTEREPVSVSATFALDLVNTEGTLLMDMSSAVLNYASKVEFAPVKAPATEQASGLTDAVLDGRAIGIDPATYESIMPFSDDALGLMDENGTAIGVVFEDPNVLSEKKTGTFPIIPVFQADGKIAQPDTSKPSTITIIEHTEDTLHFEIEANLCMADISELPALIQADVPDYCQTGDKETIKSKAALGFPDTFRSDSQLEAAPTENYRALRNLRLARIKGEIASLGRPANAPSFGGSDNGPAASTDSPETIVVGEQPGGQCGVLQSDGACDCSCEGRACSEQKILANTLLPTERACRLTCGKRWQSCQP